MKKGITLVVLIITIIVMVTLTGTVIVILKDSGIITRAQETVSAREIAVAKEKIMLEMQPLKVKAKMDRKTIAEYLEDNSIDLTEKGISYVLRSDKMIFTVNDTANVITDLDGRVNDKTIYKNYYIAPKRTMTNYGITLTYDDATGIYTLNGTGTVNYGITFITKSRYSIELNEIGEWYTLCAQYVSGDFVAPIGKKSCLAIFTNGVDQFNYLSCMLTNNESIITTPVAMTSNREIIAGMYFNCYSEGTADTPYTFNDFKFKIALYKGKYSVDKLPELQPYEQSIIPVIE